MKNISRYILLILVIVSTVDYSHASTIPTLTINSVTGTGVIRVDVVENGKKELLTIGEDTTAAGTAAEIAHQINNAYGDGTADSVDNVVELLKGSRLSILLSDNIDASEDLEKFAQVSFSPVGMLSFDSNPLNGQSTLVTDATITAGFAAGLSQVSLSAIAGESISQLASSLNSALDSAGYMTTLLGDQVLLYANGSVGTPEFNFALTYLGSVGNSGIVLNVETVPEPDSFALIIVGLAAPGLTATKRISARS